MIDQQLTTDLTIRYDSLDAQDYTTEEIKFVADELAKKEGYSSKWKNSSESWFRFIYKPGMKFYDDLRRQGKNVKPWEAVAFYQANRDRSFFQKTINKLTKTPGAIAAVAAPAIPWLVPKILGPKSVKPKGQTSKDILKQPKKTITPPPKVEKKGGISDEWLPGKDDLPDVPIPSKDSLFDKIWGGLKREAEKELQNVKKDPIGSLNKIKNFLAANDIVNLQQGLNSNDPAYKRWAEEQLAILLAEQNQPKLAGFNFELNTTTIIIIALGIVSIILLTQKR